MLKQLYRQSACCLQGPGQQHSAAQLLYLRTNWSRAKSAEICPISGNTSGPYQMDTSLPIVAVAVTVAATVTVTVTVVQIMNAIDCDSDFWKIANQNRSHSQS